MDEINQQLLQAKLEAIFGTLEAGVQASTKAGKLGLAQQIEESLARKKVIDFLQTELKLSKEEAEWTAKKLKAEADLRKLEEANEAKAKSAAEKNLESAGKIKSIVDKTVDALSSAAQSALASQQAAYASKELFMGAAPTIDFFANSVKAVTSIISSAVQSIPGVGVIAGMWATTAEKTANAFIDLAAQSAKIQLERAQHVFNAMNEMSKAGVSFAGNLAYLGKSAHDSGLDISTYSDFIKESLPHLQKMGGTVADSSVRIARFSKEIAKGNSQLVVMYGGYDGYMSAVADYHSRLQQYGVDITSNNKNLKTSTLDYLKTQKALTEITGKSADQFEKEARERQADVAYQASLRSLGDNQLNVENMMSLIQQYAGDTFYKPAMEAIANKSFDVTQDRNPENRGRLNQMQEGQAEILNSILRLAKEGKMSDALAELKRLNQTQIVQAKNQEGYIQHFMSTGMGKEAMPEFMSKSFEDLSLAMVNEKTLANMPDAFDKIMKKAGEQNTQAKQLVELMDTKIRLGQKIDEKVIGGIAQTIKLTNQLYEFQNLIVDKFPDFGEAVDKFVTIINKMLKGDDTEITPEQAAVNKSKRKAKADGNLAPLKTQAEQMRRTAATDKDTRAGAQNVLDTNNARDIRRFGGKAFLEAIAAGKSDVQPNFDQVLPPSIMSRLKSREAIGGGDTSDSMIAALDKLLTDPLYSGAKISAINDDWHQDNAPGSKHTSGKAADLVIPGMNAAMAAEIRKKFPELVSANFEQKGEGKATGNHIHLESKYKGGTMGANDTTIVGEGGPEIVSGAGVTTSTASTSAIFNKMLTSLEDLLRVAKDNRDYSEKISKSVA